MPGCQSFVLTLPCRRLGVDTPWIGVVVATVLGLSLFFGTGILELLPMPIIGGVLFFIGGDLLDTWLVKVRKRLHRADYGIIVLICVVIAVFGFIEGVGVGMLATLALFAFRLSRVDVVAEEFSAGQRSSTKIRTIPDRAILLDRGEWLRAYRLRGYIFFGSAHRLVDRLKQPVRSDSRPVCIVLDFAAVSRCDLSAITLLCQFARSVHSAGVRVVICAASDQIEGGLRSSLPSRRPGPVLVRDGSGSRPRTQRGCDPRKGGRGAPSGHERWPWPPAASRCGRPGGPPQRADSVRETRGAATTLAGAARV